MTDKPWTLDHISPSGYVDIRTYRRYRKDGMTLNHKIMETTLDRAAIQYAGRALGMRSGDDVLVFDSEDDTSVMMDYALYEYLRKGKNAIERYREEVGGETQVERELLAAMEVSSTSLFRVEAVSRQTHTIYFSDLVAEDRTIHLVDINFSQHVLPGWLSFFRPITFESFSMTSGVAFVFQPGMEEELLRHWRRPARRVIGHTDSAKRYVTFFKLSKRVGREVRYEAVEGEQD
jgi:hypothetical protein